MCRTNFSIYQCTHCYQESPIPCDAVKPRRRGWFSCFFPDPPPCSEIRSYQYANGYCPSCVQLYRSARRIRSTRHVTPRKKRRTHDRERTRARDQARRLMEDAAAGETYHHHNSRAIAVNPAGLGQIYNFNPVMNNDSAQRTRRRSPSHAIVTNPRGIDEVYHSRPAMEYEANQQTHHHRNSRAIIKNPAGLDQIYTFNPVMEDNAGQQTRHHHNSRTAITDPMEIDQVYHSEPAMAARLELSVSPTSSVSPGSPGLVSPLTQSEANGPTWTL
ncbi:hypothetical protein G7Z17_g9703 [Cylindrodendrum hubeiense]|uniref:Uncharacterized protein n=1 Tax=Cylindrodendrum hubeiense TaxID=595255 RepID=A0A9P5LDE6_9HYPO|nr:hypothetical protein G7Z17_g9703 [Cylindrodendrum hubeiense]